MPLLDLTGSPASRDDVLRYFLRVEQCRGRFEGVSTDLKERVRAASSVSGVSGDELLGLTLEYFTVVGDRDCPVVTWTAGDRSKEVRRWKLVDVPLTAFYSKGVNEGIDPHLLKVGRNIAAFAPSAGQHPGEFKRLAEVPEGEMRTLIGVVKEADYREGKVQLIDGFHRCVSMVRHGIQTAPAYLALTFDD